MLTGHQLRWLLTTGNKSLVTFISLQSINSITLILDYIIIKLQYPSISEIIQFISPILLGIHFYYFTYENIFRRLYVYVYLTIR